MKMKQMYQVRLVRVCCAMATACNGLAVPGHRWQPATLFVFVSLPSSHNYHAEATQPLSSSKSLLTFWDISECIRAAFVPSLWTRLVAGRGTAPLPRHLDPLLTLTEGDQLEDPILSTLVRLIRTTDETIPTVC